MLSLRPPGLRGGAAAWLLAVLLTSPLGCGEEGASPTLSDPDPPTGAAPEVAAAPRPALCRRPHGNAVSDALCAGAAITGLAELLSHVGLGPNSRAVIATSNSTSLVARQTTPLNPRVIVFPASVAGLADYVAVAFSRGEQRVELVAYDTIEEDLRFYLLDFAQPCNDAGDGCSLADLLTERVERGWTSWTLRDDEDLAGTVVDCLVCHQPAGPSTPKLLRMQELRQPWMHWFPAGAFEPITDSPSMYFRATHQHEAQYGGVPIDELLAPANDEVALRLEGLLRDYWRHRGAVPSIYASDGQDFAFDSQRVQDEALLGRVDLWREYDAEVGAGRRFAVPFYRSDVSDPARRDQAIAAYLGVALGGADDSTMIDLRDTFSDEAKEALGHRSRADATAVGLLTRYCVRCHNGRLDPSLSRARFDAERLSTLSTEERRRVLDRVMMDASSPLRMPPPEVVVLSAEAIEKIRGFLGP